MDKIPELLLKLLENSPLVTLFFGVFLIILGGAEKLPFGSTTLIISSQVKVILLVVGIVLTLISALTLFKDKIFGITKERNGEFSLENQQKLESQQNEIEELKEIIKDIKEFVKSRSDDVSPALLNILNGVEDRVKDQTREFEKASRESRLASQWLLKHYVSILKSIRFSETNNKSLGEFCDEITKYVEILIESLNKAKYITPGARNISFHIGYSLPYVKALQSFKAQIKHEVDQHQSLSETELKIFNDCIDQLIDDIRYESSC